MAYGDTIPEIRRRLSRVVEGTNGLYVLAVEPRTAGGGAGIPPRSVMEGLSRIDRTAAAIERDPPSPGYLGGAIHHCGSLSSRYVS